MQSPTLSRIIWTDYPSFIYTVLAAVIWIVLICWAPNWRGNGAVIPPTWLPYLLGLALVITTWLAVSLAWRVRFIRSIFRHGQQIHGYIDKISFRNDRGTAEYTYNDQGNIHKIQAKLHYNKQTRSLKVGQRVTLVVDKQDPQQAFIRDLYI